MVSNEHLKVHDEMHEGILIFSKHEKKMLFSNKQATKLAQTYIGVDIDS